MERKISLQMHFNSPCGEKMFFVVVVEKQSRSDDKRLQKKKEWQKARNPFHVDANSFSWGCKLKREQKKKRKTNSAAGLCLEPTHFSPVFFFFAKNASLCVSPFAKFMESFDNCYQEANEAAPISSDTSDCA